MQLSGALMACLVGQLLVHSIRADGATIYVDRNAPGPIHNGSTWNSAYSNLQEALASAWDGATIRVAQGVYRPDQGVMQLAGDRGASFVIDNIRLEGGYAGNGAPDPNARDFELYETVLSGDLLNNDTSIGCDVISECPLYSICMDGTCSVNANIDDNSYHVVRLTYDNDLASIDGFTIIGGNAGGDGSDEDIGAGILSRHGSVTIRNCSIENNAAKYHGGGVLADSRPTIVEDCRFVRNTAKQRHGGAIRFRYTLDTAIARCHFEFNSAIDGNGGAVASDQGTTVIDSCLFDGNIAYNAGSNGCGGAVWAARLHSLFVIDSVFCNNSAELGGALYGDDLALTVAGSLFTGNVAKSGGAMYAEYCDVVIADCSYTSNSAWIGGAFYNLYSYDTSIVNTVFLRNHADDRGGTVAHASLGNFRQCKFLGNKVTTDSTFHSGGGAVWQYNALTTWTDCVFIGNESAAVGGAVYNQDDVNFIMRNSTMVANTAQREIGGAVYSYL